MTQKEGLENFVLKLREEFQDADDPVRVVKLSELEKESNPYTLEGYIGNKVPFYYRSIEDIIDSIKEDESFFVTIRETLGKLPSSEDFQESHFGEITATIFAEEILNLKKLYSKLSFLSAENANAYKMDLLLYDPNSNPIDFYLGEVKSSPKSLDEKDPPEHHKSCYASLFNSLNSYETEDMEFDLGTVKDRLKDLDPTEKERVKKALRPYTSKSINYAGFVLIDLETKVSSEIRVLSERKNDKELDVDLICIEDYSEVAHNVYQKVKEVHDQCFQ